MDVLSDANEGIRLLDGLESGQLNIPDAHEIAKKIDPLLVFFIVKFLKEVYMGSDQAEGVMTRLVDLTSTYPDIAKIIKDSENDVMVEWFEDSYSYKQFRTTPESFVQTIVDKLEG